MTFIRNQIQNTHPQTWKSLPSNDPFQNTVWMLTSTTTVIPFLSQGGNSADSCPFSKTLYQCRIVDSSVPVLEKCYENAILACRLSTFHAVESYPWYRNWYSWNMLCCDRICVSSPLYTIRETNFLAKKCVSAKPIHEQRTAFTHYSFIHHSFRRKLFRRIFLLSFVKKPPHQRNCDETLAMKNRFAENGLHTICVSPTFRCFVVIRK